MKFYFWISIFATSIPNLNIWIKRKDILCNVHTCIIDANSLLIQSIQSLLIQSPLNCYAHKCQKNVGGIYEIRMQAGWNELKLFMI